MKRVWDDWSNLVCTAPRCRTYVKSGDGNQFFDDDGDLQRYCIKHWELLFQEPEHAEGRSATEDGTTSSDPGVQQAPTDI